MADYDEFADRYDQTFQLMPFRTYIEAYSILKLLGEVEGQAWLDVACGTGAYSREIRRRGASQVVGVDLSPEMIRIARTAEAAEPLGVEYLVQDVATLDEIGSFDGALGNYLLHYSTSEEHLRAMCNGISRNLRPGARFVTHQLNPAFSQEPGYYLRYGSDFKFPSDDPLAEGESFLFRVVVGDFQSPYIPVYYWSRATLDCALADAGFGEIRWSMPELSPEGHRLQSAEWWQKYSDRPIGVLIEAVKK